MMPVALRSAWLLIMAATVASAPAWADEQPHRRAGLWEVTRTGVDINNPARMTRVCIDPGTETTLRDVGASFARSTCSSTDIHASQSKVTADAVCELGSSRATSHTVITFAGDTAYSQVSTTQLDPPLYGRSEVTTEVEGKWLGPCDADMRPGDMFTAMGKINRVDRVAQQK
jgi:hypothetical protein